MWSKLQGTTQEDLMFLQMYQRLLWCFLHPLKSCGCQQAPWGEEQLSPPWEKHVTPSGRNTKAKEQKEESGINDCSETRNSCFSLPALIKSQIQLLNLGFWRIWKGNKGAQGPIC